MSRNRGAAIARESSSSQEISKEVRSPKDALYKMHPRAEKMFQEFNGSQPFSSASLREHKVADALYPYDRVELSLFFNSRPFSASMSFLEIDHVCAAYTLYQMAQEGEILLHFFDSSATVSEYPCGPSSTFLGVSEGMFTITLLGSPNIELVLDIDNYPSGVSWGLHYVDIAHYVEFSKVFKDAQKLYNPYIGHIFDYSGKFLTLDKTSLHDIEMPAELRAEILTNIVDYVDPVKIQQKILNRVPTKRGIIFNGAPGTGKTFTTRALASTLGMSFMRVTQIQSHHDIPKIFEFCAKFPSIILLFEDIDLYVSDRREVTSSAELSALLNCMDGMEINTSIIVLCTTNDVKGLDKALSNRPGRFDRILYFAPPTKPLVKKMYINFCEGKDISQVALDDVVEKTPSKFTGAHIKEVYITATLAAIEAGSVNSEGIAVLTTAHFLNAIKRVGEYKMESTVGYESH